MSQFDAKIIYIQGGNNTVADALSQLPSNEKSVHAEKSACHPYAFCDNNDTYGVVASISLPRVCGPWESATSPSSLPSSLDKACTTLKITADKEFLNSVKNGYKDDMWCKSLPSTNHSLSNLKFCDGLWYIGDRMIIPWTSNFCETLFALAHDVLRHFGFNKMYGSL